MEPDDVILMIHDMLRDFFGDRVDTWPNRKQLELFEDWVRAMRRAGELMMRAHGRHGVPSPPEAIAFDSPQSFLNAWADGKL